MQKWAEKFYKGKEWIKLRNAYFASQYGICERCSEPGLIVHHKIYLTPKNIGNPEVSLNWDLLELLCLECHNKEHGGDVIADGLMFDEDGNLVKERQAMRGYKFDAEGNMVPADVYVVWGAPASGKTTYVRNHMKPGDLVVDLDLIKQAISMQGRDEVDGSLLNIAIQVRDMLYSLVANRKVNSDVWVVACLPKDEQRDKLGELLKTSKFIYINATKEECIQRALSDSERTDKELQLEIIETWFNSRCSGND